MAASSDLPTACTLSAADRPAREASVRALFASAVVAVERPVPGRLVYRFRGEPGVRERFVALAEAESHCCAFLDFQVGVDALTITAPAGAEAALDELFGPSA
jgi:hypothetical protein